MDSPKPISRIRWQKSASPVSSRIRPVAPGWQLAERQRGRMEGVRALRIEVRGTETQFQEYSCSDAISSLNQDLMLKCTKWPDFAKNGVIIAKNAQKRPSLQRLKIPGFLPEWGTQPDGPTGGGA